MSFFFLQIFDTLTKIHVCISGHFLFTLPHSSDDIAESSAGYNNYNENNNNNWPTKSNRRMAINIIARYLFIIFYRTVDVARTGVRLKYKYNIIFQNTAFTEICTRNARVYACLCV